MSEDFAPHWSRFEFYKDFEKKSVYEAEDLVIERFAGSDGDVMSGAMKRLPYVTTLCLGARPVLYQGLPSIGASHPVYERTIVCVKRFGKPKTYSGDGIPSSGSMSRVTRGMSKEPKFVGSRWLQSRRPCPRLRRSRQA